MSRRELSLLVHDVAKYVARTARNLPAEPTRAMIDMLVRDLYELRPGQRASRVFAQLAEFADAPPLEDVRALFGEIDALEGAVRAGALDAVTRAAAIARDIEARLRAVAA